MKRITLILSCLILFSANIVHASSGPQRISAHLNPDITIKVGDQVKSFYDANGKVVFPIIYQGTTYLPVRAVSSLMGENIEWDNKGKTVYIGRTLSDPSKSVQGPYGSYARDGDIPQTLKPPVQLIDALIMRDVIIMYDFGVQSFLDATGREVYPINYQGSNYLPIRAISRLMGEDIEWDSGQRLITISNKNDTDGTGDNAPDTAAENIKKLRSFLSDIVKIFDETTAKIVSLQNSLAEEELSQLAASVSRDLQKINRIIASIKNIDTDDFSDEESHAYNSLLSYAESTGYYILITENIVYMASASQDYSMFAETFLSFAMDAQSKYEIARDALKEL